MIILFGGSGYIGSEFKMQLNKKRTPFINWENARNTDFDQLQTLIKYNKISHVINAAGYTGKPNVDACEINKKETFYGNVLWPQILSNWCALNNIVFGHVSSGCIYTGKRTDGSGFTEEDEPNFTFKQNNCSFYSGTKALAEKNIPFGTYNIVNSGYTTTEKLVDKLKQTIAKNKQFHLINDNELYKNYAKTPRSNCIMNNSKLLSTGIKMRSVDESLDWCLRNWKSS